MNSKQLKAAILQKFPHWKIKKIRREELTHVYLFTPSGCYIPPTGPVRNDEKYRGAYTDYGKSYEEALRNLAKTHNIEG